MTNLLVDSGPDAMKDVNARAWRRAMGTAKFLVFVNEVPLILELASQVFGHSGAGRLHLFRVFSLVVAIIAIPYVVWQVPTYFKSTEERLAELGGSEDDLEKFRKSVGSATESFCMLTWIISIFFVS